MAQDFGLLKIKLWHWLLMKARLVASQGDEEAGKAYGCRRPVLTTTCSCKSKSMSARLGHLPSDHISPVMRMVC